MARAGLIVLLLGFWALSLDFLSVFPAVGQDEPWIAAAPVKLATAGQLGSDLFAGYYGMERHHFQHPPLYPLLQALLFRLAGVGVFQMRFLAVACGLLVLALTCALGRQSGGRGVALLAGLLLVGLRVAEGGGATGIPLLDQARVSRYDILVPVFGLAALYRFNQVERRAARSPDGARAGDWLGVGVLVGLAGLSHLYGLFWLPVFGLIGIWRRGRAWFWLSGLPLLLGALLPWLPWLIFAARHWDDALGQQRMVTARFDLFHWRFYLQNARNEGLRYGALDLWERPGVLRGGRVGSWLLLGGLPAALWATGRGPRHPPDERGVLGVALVGHLFLFALLLSQKDFRYLIVVWPLALLLLATGAQRLWRAGRRGGAGAAAAAPPCGGGGGGRRCGTSARGGGADAPVRGPHGPPGPGYPPGVAGAGAAPLLVGAAAVPVPHVGAPLAAEWRG